MSPKRKIIKKTKRQTRKYQVELSFKSLIFWSVGFFFFMAWIFVLGILVGRGFLPSGVKTLAELTDQITKLQDMINRKDTMGIEALDKQEEEPKFAFFDELSVKKEGQEKEEEKNITKIAGKINLQKTPGTKQDMGGQSLKKENTALKKPTGNIKKADQPIHDKKAYKKKETKAEPEVKKKVRKISQTLAVKEENKTSQDTKLAKKKEEKVVSSKAEVVYALQIASLEIEKEAKEMSERLASEGYPAYYYKVKIKGKKYFRVRCGPFSSRREVIDFKNLLAAQEGIEGFIDKVK